MSCKNAPGDRKNVLGERAIVLPTCGRHAARRASVVRARTIDIYGCMAGSVKVVGDVVAPIDVEWLAAR